MKSNLVLSGVLILLSVFMYWFVYHKKPNDEKIEEVKKRLFMTDVKDELEKVSIRYKTKEKDKEYDIDLDMECKENCALQNPNAKWDLLRPILFKADEGNIVSFVNTLSTTRINDSLLIEGERESFLSRFGLSNTSRALRSIVVKLKNHTHQIFLGDEGAVNDNLYLLVETDGKTSNQVHIVPANIRASVNRSISHWRSKKLFSFAASQIQSFDLINTNGKITFNKNDKGNWDSTEKDRAIDQQTVDTFVTGLVYMNAQEYLSDDKKSDFIKYKFPSKARNTLNLRVKPPKGNEKDEIKTIRLDLYEVSIEKKPAKIFGIFNDKNFIVELDKTGTDKFNKKSSEFWDKNVLSLDQKKGIRKIKTTLFDNDDKKKVSVVYSSKDDGIWEPETKGQTADSNMIVEALNRFQTLKVDSFSSIQKPPKGSDRELSSWEFFDKEGKLVRSIVIYGDTEKKNDYYIRFKNSPFSGVIAKLEKATAIKLPINVKGFQKAEAQNPNK